MRIMSTLTQRRKFSVAGALYISEKNLLLPVTAPQITRRPMRRVLRTHPGKVEAPYTVCIASASNLTGLVKSSVECRRTGL